MIISIIAIILGACLIYCGGSWVIGGLGGLFGNFALKGGKEETKNE